MIYNVYSFYDKVSKSYKAPVCDTQPVENLVECYYRDIKRIINDEKALSQLKDHNLLLVATFDDNSGKLISFESPELIIDFDSLILNNLGGKEA